MATGSTDVAAGGPAEKTPARRFPGSDWYFLLGVPLIAAVALLGLEATDIDRTVTNWFFDPAAGGFPLRNSFFLDVILHHWPKYVVVLIALLTLAGFVLSYRIPALQPERRVLLFLFLALALAPASVSALKSVSGKYCPWDLEQYGGFAPYSRLVEPAPPSFRPGRCFPAGYASTGFALMAFYFVGRARKQPRLAWAGLATGLITGLVLGLGRMLQGAHFLSHVLWSALVCWIVITMLYALIIERTNRAGQTPGA